MSLGIDTDVLVSWAMLGAPHHDAARRLLETEIRSRTTPIALTPQVFFEFIHVVTDPRRFERPMPMNQAVSVARDLWDAPETIRVLPGPSMLHRVFELLESLCLGRKRILDTALGKSCQLHIVRSVSSRFGSLTPSILSGGSRFPLW